MKKNLFMVAAVALMALTACTKENVNEGGAQAPEMPAPSYYVEFTAEAANDDAAATPSAPSSAQSKTTFDESAKKTLWSSDDLISVNGKKFKVDKLIEGGLKARFINAEELGEDFGAPFTAIYPYDATQGQAEVPAVQTVSAGSFAEESVVTVAYSAEDNTLSFKHVNSVLKFQVPAACDVVTITSDDALAGTIKVNGVTTENVDYSILDAKKEVTVNGPFVIGKDYYVAVLPGEKTNFKVYVDGYYSKGAASVTPQRSKVMNMKTLPVPTEWGWLVTMENNKYYMVKSTVYTDLYVLKNVNLGGTGYKFKFVNNTGDKTVGAYGSSTANVDCSGQINEWYDSQAASSHAAFIYVTTSAKYDIFFSPTDLNFLIINAGKDTATSKWAMVGWFGSESSGQDKWSYANGIKLTYNYVLCVHTMTRKLTNNDYFLFVEDNNWASWIGSPGYEYGNNGRNTTNYSISVGGTKDLTLHHSWGDEKAQFHMVNTGKYEISLNIGNKYEEVKVKFKRIE